MNNDNIELRSQEFQEILGKMPHWILRSGIAIIFIFIVAIMVVLNYLHYPDKITSKAIITTRSATANVLSPGYGYLKLVAKNKQTVRQKQIVAYIKSPAQYEDIVSLSALLDKLPVYLTDPSLMPKINYGLQLGELQSAYLQLANKLERYKSTALFGRASGKPNMSVDFASQQRLQDINITAGQIKNDLEMWENKFFITAPISGRVYMSPDIDENNPVAFNQPIFKIKPNDTSLVIKCFVPMQNAGKLQVNQKVLVRLDDYPYEEFGMINGSIESISDIPVNGFYYAKARLANGLISTRRNKITFKQEMTGTGEIITKDKSVFERIFNQFYKLIN